MSVLVQCLSHPQYTALRPPRTKCGTCALLWAMRQGKTLESESLGRWRGRHYYSSMVIA